MTPQERIARAQRAQMALDEFFAPVIDGIRADYQDKLQTVATQELNRAARCDKITALSTALKIVDGFSASISAIIKDGEVARKDLSRMEARNDLTGPRRRLLNIGTGY